MTTDPDYFPIPPQQPELIETPEIFIGPPPRTSALLEALAKGEPDERVPISAIIKELGRRAQGLMLVMFALPCIIPMPPGVATVCGVILLTVSVQMLIGLDSMWLPEGVRRRTLARADLKRIVEKALPAVRKFERFCRPRLGFISGRVGRMFVGAVVSVLAAITILPIPFLGNLPPGIATAIIGLGLVERDGVILSAGLLASIAAVAISGTAVWAVIVAII